MTDWSLPDDVVVKPLGVQSNRTFDSIPAMQRWAAREGVTVSGESYRKRGDDR